MNNYGLLIDTTRCVGCMECENVCAERWEFPAEERHVLSAHKNTAVYEVGEVYVPRQCMHCASPSCESVCPVGAFRKTNEGPVLYDVEKCIGCRYCMQACPFDVPKYQWDSANPRVTKCDMCYDRTSKGEATRCSEACPAEARVFGPIDELIAEARRRIEEDPDAYYPHIYGVKEVGGTSVLYLSNKPMTELGLRSSLPEQALPDLTWAVLSKIPNYVFWSGTLLAGVWWITNRRSEVHDAEQAGTKTNGSNQRVQEEGK